MQLTYSHLHDNLARTAHSWFIGFGWILSLNAEILAL